MLADIESIRVTSEELATHQRGIVTVAALPSIAASVLPGAIRQLTNDHPGIAVRIVELIGTRVSDAVKAGEVDFGVGSHARIDRELTYQHLWSDRMAAFVPVRHPLARKRAVTFRELASYPLILTRRDSSVRVLVDRMLERERISVNVVHEASYVSTLIALVAAGLGHLRFFRSGNSPAPSKHRSACCPCARRPWSATSGSSAAPPGPSRPRQKSSRMFCARLPCRRRKASARLGAAPGEKACRPKAATMLRGQRAAR